MKISQATSILDGALSPELQEKYDNTGRQIIFHDAEISGILLALDIDSGVIGEAGKKGCNLIISHHPLFFSPARRLDTRDAKSAMAISLIDKRISVYSAHTNLDKLYYDRLARVLELPDPVLLNKTDTRFDSEPVGFGIISRLTDPIRLSDLLENVKTRLGLDYVIYAGDRSSMIRSVAVVQGAGGRAIEHIAADGLADCIITGDVGYHHAKNARDCGVATIDAGHFGTERILLKFLKDHVTGLLAGHGSSPEINVYISETETSPFKMYGKNNEQ